MSTHDTILSLLAERDAARAERDALARQVEALEAAVGEQRHIVDIADDRFGLQHPVECRPDLLSCPFEKAMRALPGPPMPPGRYVLKLTEYGDPVCLPLAADDEAAR